MPSAAWIDSMHTQPTTPGGAACTGGARFHLFSLLESQCIIGAASGSCWELIVQASTKISGGGTIRECVHVRP